MRTKKINLGILSQIFATILNTIMGALKLEIGFITGCVSVLSDGYNNLVDAIGNIVGGVGIYLNDKKPNAKYPHGYGRVEEIITLLMLLAFIAVGGYFIGASLERFFYHEKIKFMWWRFAIVAVTAVVKFGMFIGYSFVLKRNPSPIIKANRMDSLMDTVVTSLSLVSYGTSALGTFPIDSLIGIVIGVMIVVSLIRSLKVIFHKLVGNNEIDNVTQKLTKSGLNLTVIDAHAYGERIEAVVKEEVCTEDQKMLEENKIYIKTK